MSRRLLALDGPECASSAMARDLVLVRALSTRGDRAELLRLHGWSVPALTIGRSQSLDRPGAARLRGAGVRAARRPTGGGWLLHLPGDLAVSLIAAGPLRVGELRGVAHRLAGLIRDGLEAAGRTARLVSTEATPASRAEMCFSRLDRDELEADGVKLAGVALARIGRGALVQAAVPVAAARGGLAAVERAWDPKRSRTVAMLAGVDALAVRRGIIRAFSAGAGPVSRWFWAPELLAGAQQARDSGGLRLRGGE